MFARGTEQRPRHPIVACQQQSEACAVAATQGVQQRPHRLFTTRDFNSLSNLDWYTE